MRRVAWIAAILAIGVVGCAESAAPTASIRASSAASAAATGSSDAQCAGEELGGAYQRELTAETTDNSDLLGAWALEIDGCTYRISVDGTEQGSGRIEMVEGTAASGRIGLSQDLGCPNEFTGTGLYDVTLGGNTLTIAEAISGTDQCVGRAGAFGDAPPWERQ